MLVFSRRFWRPLLLSALCLALGACATVSGTGSTTSATPLTTPTPGATFAATPTGPLAAQPFDVAQFQAAYGVDALIKQGFTGKGQTVIDIVSYGSPTLTQDVAAFSQHNNLPTANIQVIAPIGTVPFDPSNSEMAGWQAETTLDVEIIHALAPDAKIVVLTSPVDETEGTAGLPQFRQLVQYAVDHKLGNVVSMSWGASEISLTNDPAGKNEVNLWDTLFHTSTQQGVTYLASSGDLGATDYSDVQLDVSPTRTSGFPADDPWVTSVGGTSLYSSGSAFRETVWNDGSGASGGGFSTFFSVPDYQKTVAASSATPFNNERGIPDVAADADPATGLNVDIAGSFTPAGGTSASAPAWAGIMALADQMAGHTLGFINTGLYQLAASSTAARDFHDITVGDNSVNAGGTSVQGFSAGPGWDAATGLGSPDAQYLVPDLIAALKG
jgi:subtilase family serine protease